VIVRAIAMFIGASDGSRLTLPAAGTVDVSSGKAGIIRGKLHINRGELCGLARSAENGRVAELFVLFLRRSATDLERRPHRSWCHAVYADAPGCCRQMADPIAIAKV
jgi:hypothetical protein